MLEIVMQLQVDLNRSHFEYYSHNYESMIMNMTMITTRNNYDYIYDYMTNVTILR